MENKQFDMRVMDLKKGFSEEDKEFKFVMQI